MALIDTHCHLDLYNDPSAVVAEAHRVGVYLISMTTTPTAFQGTKALEPKGGRIRTALGLHPELAAEHEIELFERYLPTTLYVGEVGIDGTGPHKSTIDQQGRIFGRILDLCAAMGGRTLSIHSRGAAGLVLDMIQGEPLAGQFILHWWLGSKSQTQRAVALGCWFSISPTMLRSERGRSIASFIPRDRVLPESDGPFGTLNDKPLFPWQAQNVAHDFAKIWGVSCDEASSKLVSNFRHMVAQAVSADETVGKP
jgi:TatD DNase family protein